MQQHIPTWIVVADAGRARILYLEREGAAVRRVFEEEDASARRFAVAEVVNEMVRRDSSGFDRLILVAAPNTLHGLRDALSDEARGCVSAECAQDLSRFSDDMIVHVVGNDDGGDGHNGHNGHNGHGHNGRGHGGGETSRHGSMQ
jgi:hypothetical protein